VEIIIKRLLEIGKSLAKMPQGIFGCPRHHALGLISSQGEGPPAESSVQAIGGLGCLVA